MKKACWCISAYVYVFLPKKSYDSCGMENRKNGRVVESEREREREAMRCFCWTFFFTLLVFLRLLPPSNWQRVGDLEQCFDWLRIIPICAYVFFSFFIFIPFSLPLPPSRLSLAPSHFVTFPHQRPDSPPLHSPSLSEVMYG